MLKTKTGLIPFLVGDDAWNDVVWPFAIDVPCVTVNSEGDAHCLDRKIGDALLL